MTDDVACPSDSDDDDYNDDDDNSGDHEKCLVLFSRRFFFSRLRHLLKWNLLTSIQTIQILLDTLSKYNCVLRFRVPPPPPSPFVG